MDENNNSHNIAPRPEIKPSHVPLSAEQKPVIAQSEHYNLSFSSSIKHALIIISCVFLIGSLFIFSMILATIFGPHSSCDKWGCSPSNEAVIIYGLGSLLISVPISKKILKSGFKK